MRERAPVRPAGGAAALLLPLLMLGCVSLARGRKVDVGGHRLFVECSGKGAPTVIMDAGLGDTLETWDEVRPALRKLTRVCVYDRAGLGKSEPGPLPRTSERIVTELHALLEKAEISGPYVMVGHSFGGMNVRLYASRYPGEVAGLVLIEATHEDYPARERALASPDERRKLEAASASSAPAAESEYRSLEDSAEQVRAAGPIPRVPLAILTARRHGGSPELKEVWAELQADLARLVPDGSQILAEESGHYVQFDQPALVSDTIRRMVEKARQNAGR